MNLVESPSRRSKSHLVRFGVAAVFDWGLVAVGFALPHVWNTIPVWIAAMVLIATRQHALLILMHEGAHFHLHPNRRWNDLWSDLFFAYPFFATTAGYRLGHLEHHRHSQTERDPDIRFRSEDSNWKLPKTPTEFALSLLRAFLWQGMAHTIRGFRFYSRMPEQKRLARESGVFPKKIAFYLSWIVGLTLVHGWSTFFLLWVVPMLTFFRLFMRLRSLAEHWGLPEDVGYPARSTVPAAWEQFLFLPHQVSFHAVHHHFPGVPFYALRETHSKLRRDPEYRKLDHVNRGYFFGPKSVVRDFTRREVGRVHA
jgi:fatty acid desaturase